MKMLHSEKTNQQSQGGFVSIIVAAMIMVILSLITIGFTRIMQREQRQALDRQLSRKAIYAAESGINDVYSALRSNPNLPIEKTDCDVVNDIGGQPNPAVNKGVIDENGVVAYTCALYDKTPSELIYSVNSSESKVFELKTESGLAFSTLNIRWANEQGENGISSLPTCGADANTFPGNRNGMVPVLRLDLTNTAVLARDNLINGTDYMYLVPCKDASPSIAKHKYNISAVKGETIQVACNASNSTSPCEVSIENLNALSFATRLRSVYDSAKVFITATDSANNPVEFKQAQTSIDVTARSNDVVRRLRVAIPLASVNSPPEAVFQAFDGVCKLMSVDINSAPARISDACN